MADYKKVKVEAGKSGWGGPLEIQPTDEKNTLFVLLEEVFIQLLRKLLT